MPIACRADSICTAESATSWDGATLRFYAVPATGSTGLQVMLPTQAGGLHLTTVSIGGSPVVYTVQTIKGVQYAVMPAGVGQYAATYAP